MQKKRNLRSLLNNKMSRLKEWKKIVNKRWNSKKKSQDFNKNFKMLLMLKMIMTTPFVESTRNLKIVQMMTHLQIKNISIHKIKMILLVKN